MKLIAKHLGLSLLAGTAALVCAVSPAQAADNKPNVVFILADNVGYGDLGPYGGGELRGYPTPTLRPARPRGIAPDAISRGAGLHAVTRCAHDGAILDPRGTVAHRPAGLRPITLSAKSYTMGELFKDAGYATAMFGKWHLAKIRRACRPRTVSMNSMASRRTPRGTTAITTDR